MIPAAQAPFSGYFSGTERFALWAAGQVVPALHEMTEGERCRLVHNAQYFYGFNFLGVVLLASVVFPIIGWMSTPTAVWLGGMSFAGRTVLLIKHIGMELSSDGPDLAYAVCRLIGFFGEASRFGTENLLARRGYPIELQACGDRHASFSLVGFEVMRELPRFPSGEGAPNRPVRAGEDSPPRPVRPQRGAGAAAYAAVAQPGAIPGGGAARIELEPD